MPIATNMAHILPKSRAEKLAAMRRLYETSDPTKSNTTVRNEIAEIFKTTERTVLRLVTKHKWVRTVDANAQQAGRPFKPDQKPEPKTEPKAIKPHFIAKPLPKVGKLVKQEPLPEPIKPEGFTPTEDSTLWELLDTSDKMKWVQEVADRYLDSGIYYQQICQSIGLPVRLFRKWIKDDMACRDIWVKNFNERAYWATEDMLFFIVEMAKLFFKRVNEAQIETNYKFQVTGIDDRLQIAGEWIPTSKKEKPSLLPDPEYLTKWSNALREMQSRIESMRSNGMGNISINGHDIETIDRELQQLQNEYMELVQANG